eukprot:scaffold174094_cov47-Attheya_sp.AAC.2
MSHIQSSTFCQNTSPQKNHGKSIRNVGGTSQQGLLQRGIITAGTEQGKCSPKTMHPNKLDYGTVRQSTSDRRNVKNESKA